MKQDFELVKAQISIKEVAIFLMGQPVRGMFRFPGERTPSLKIYEETQTFFDYGRHAGGDVFRLYSHVKNISNWDALKEICSLYNIDMMDSNENIREQIKKQEMAQKARRDAEKQRKRRWVKEVDKLKAEVEKYDALMTSEHVPKTSDVFKWCMEYKQLAEYRLDAMCGICN